VDAKPVTKTREIDGKDWTFAKLQTLAFELFRRILTAQQVAAKGLSFQSGEELIVGEEDLKGLDVSSDVLLDINWL